MRSRITAIVLAVGASLAVAGSTLATDCVNASKPQPAGVQVVIDATTDEVVWTAQGVAARADRGVLDLATGAGFHGLIGLDLDGDAIADVSTWFGVGPEGTEIPEQAQLNGPACRGITDIEVYFNQCLGQ